MTADAVLFDFSGSASSDPPGTGVATQQRDETPDSVANVSPEQVEIVRTDSGTDTPYFQLRISGTNFFIKRLSAARRCPPRW